METREICAVIPTYRPDSEFADRLKMIAAQVGCVVVVDDSDSIPIASELDFLSSHYKQIVVIHNPKNQGLAASLNGGIKEANRLGYNWILTLDDDTAPDSDMCHQLADAWTNFPQSHNVGVLAMSWNDGHHRETSAEDNWKDKIMVITSGSFFPMKTFERVGQFRDEFIIDSVDSDFCLRVRSNGLRVCQLAKRGFSQRIGLPRSVKLGPFHFAIWEHTPTRTYYRVRNSTALAIEYWHREPMYLLGVIYSHVQQLLAAMLFYKQKRAHLLAMANGFVHTIKKHFGPYEPVACKAELRNSGS